MNEKRELIKLSGMIETDFPQNITEIPTFILPFPFFFSFPSLPFMHSVKMVNIHHRVRLLNQWWVWPYLLEGKSDYG
jgi:hypothetical protein